MLSRTEIAEQVWDINFDSATNVIDVAVRRLRGKLDAPFERTLLHTVRGMGYVLEEREMSTPGRPSAHAPARRDRPQAVGCPNEQEPRRLSRAALSTWLALQSLAGLSVVCVAVYAVTHMNLEARQIEALTQKQTQVRHLLTEETQRGDASTLTHKLDDFFVGHQDLALSLARPDGSVFYQRAVGASSPGQRARGPLRSGFDGHRTGQADRRPDTGHGR